MFVGIDVAKSRLDVHLRPSGEAFAVPRDGEGLAALVERLQEGPVELVVVEATGGFEMVVAAALAGAGLPLAIVNPRQIRDFARATGRLAKTDALDAAVIARFARRSAPSRGRCRMPRRSCLASSSPVAGNWSTPSWRRATAASGSPTRV